jgi:cellulose synthase/poly-beta-1,6-N-acetylglucosamine synthase-like glycosyltransferase
MIIIFILSLILAYLAYNVIIQLLLSLAALKKPGKPKKEASKRRFAIFIPAYKEDRVIVETVKKALSQQYDYELFRVFVIADSLQKETLDKLAELDCTVIEYGEEDRTKTKALRCALKQVEAGQFDAALVLDADNVLAPSFLERSAQAIDSGYVAMQGQRKAANLDSEVAILDAVAESVNHWIYCRGAQALGLPARLMGSGMVFEMELFRALINQIDAVGGFDKALEIELAKRKLNIAYLEDAVVYDEKVRSRQVFTQQRKRWISAQFHYLGHYVREGFSQGFKDWDRSLAYKVSILAMVPRLLLPALLVFVVLVTLLVGEESWAIWFWGLLGLHLWSLYLGVPKEFFTRPYRRAWLSLFGLFWRTLGLVFRLRRANQKFIHTPHGL